MDAIRRVRYVFNMSHSFNEKRTVSIRDMARLSGYSPSTVSMALRDHPAIKESTKDKIKAIANKHGYRANRLVEGVFSGKVRLVGIIANIDLDGAFNRRLVQMEKSLRERGYSCLMLNSHDDVQTEGDCFSAAAEHRVSGVIIQTVNYQADEHYYTELHRQNIPFVLTSEYAPRVAVPHIHLNDDELISELARHLTDLGHRRIAYIAGPAQQPMEQCLRYQGFCKGMAAAGIDPDTLPFEQASAWTIEAGYEMAKKILERDREITALVTSIDIFAMGAMIYARENGINIPKDLSVSGMGDFTYSRLLTPALTTTRRFPETIAEKAVDTLASLMERDADAPIPRDLMEQVVPGELVLRESTGPASR